MKNKLNIEFRLSLTYNKQNLALQILLRNGDAIDDFYI